MFGGFGQAKGEVIISPYDVYLDETNNAVQPDIIVVLNENIKIIDPRGHIHGVPDILVEVLSSHNRDHDQKLKKDLYERFRVQEYWIVDPENKSTTVYALENNRYKIVAEDAGMVRSTLLGCLFGF